MVDPEAAPAHPDIQVANLVQVAQCKYLGKVTGAVELDHVDGVWALWRERGHAHSQSVCLEKAAEKGATHLVWDRLQADHAIARIYQCSD